MLGSLSPEEPHLICGGDGVYRIESRAVLKKKALFTEKRLEEYFRRFAEYPPERSVVIRVSTDRAFVRDFHTPRPGSSEKEPTVIPTSGPQATFWKFGENAFFEYRDTSGQVRWKTLRGRNVYLTKLAGHEIILVGERFTCLGEGTRPPLSRQLTFVLPDLPYMADAEIAAICSFYRDQFPAAESLEVWCHSSFENVPRGFHLPTLESLKRGYSGSSNNWSKRYAWYSRFTGDVSITESGVSPVRKLKLD